MNDSQSKAEVKNDFSVKMKLTERNVATAKPSTRLSSKGTACAKYYFDTELRGFGLSVNPGGSRSFFVMRRVQNKQERHVFGKAVELTVAEARARAAKLLSQMTDGVSLNQQRKEARKAVSQVKGSGPTGVTLDQGMDLLESALRADKASERTIAGYRYFIETYLGSWRNRPLASLTRTEVRQRHADIPKEIARGKYGRKRPEADAGKLTANQALRAFRAVYNRALREFEDMPVNPIIAVRFYREERRTKRIASDDMAKWYEGVMAVTNTIRRDYLLLTLFTGLRRTNAAEVEWAHVDFKKGALHIPRPKSGRAFDLPLSGFLIELLERRKKENEVLAPDSIYVFPAARGEGHIQEVRLDGGAARKDKKPTEADEAEQAAKAFTPHDLRRTFASVAESLGISREVRQLLMNHSTPKSDVHDNYVIREFDQMRGHMEQISARLLALCQPKPSPTKATGNVVPMRKRATVAA